MKYFAFGSNLDLNQMKSRVGFLGTPGKGVLTGYKLTFDKYASSRRCGAGNLVYTGNPSDIVEGIVYTLSEEQLSKLDRYEGFNPSKPVKSTDKGYKRKMVSLTDGSSACTYIANNGDPGLKPNIEYLTHFLKGRDYLSPSYFQKLLDINVMEGGQLRDHIDIQIYENLSIGTGTPVYVPNDTIVSNSEDTSDTNAKSNAISASLLFGVCAGGLALTGSAIIVGAIVAAIVIASWPLATIGLLGVAALIASGIFAYKSYNASNNNQPEISPEVTA